jgi:succinyl-CoA synthetase alpha subunit
MHPRSPLHSSPRLTPPCTHLACSHPQVKLVVLLGELGGRDEYGVVEAMKAGAITKPVVGVGVQPRRRALPLQQHRIAAVGQCGCWRC